MTSRIGSNDVSQNDDSQLKSVVVAETPCKLEKTDSKSSEDGDAREVDRDSRDDFTD